MARDTVQVLFDGLELTGLQESCEDALELATRAGVFSQCVVDMYLAAVTLPLYHEMSIELAQELGRVSLAQLPLFRAELAKQCEDLTLLASVVVPSEETIRRLRSTGFCGIAPRKRLYL
jgi:hypothetical protein